MSRLTVPEFVLKWRRVQLTERSASQQHFLDLCEVFEHPKPAEVDPSGEWFTFERGADKHGGGRGWADVWKRGYFGWEYKGKHKNLSAAYDQLLKYREALENPPLLVVCDMDRLVLHTNFTATASQVYEIPLDELDRPRNIEIMRALFHEPSKLRPGVTSEAITTEVAERLGAIAGALRGRGLPPSEVARFLDRIVFCLFAEDVGLLPENLFSEIVETAGRNPTLLARFIGQLFDAMAEGGYFGTKAIRHFNGNLFTESPVLELTPEEMDSIREAARLDWSAVDPSIFGTLFERGLDPAKRSQLGAQYTSRQDIETLVEPVVIEPLRREWRAVREAVENLLATGKKRPTGKEKPLKKEAANRAYREASAEVRQFLERLAELKVLDPACGSGNFLYVTLQKLKDLEKEVLVYASDKVGAFLPFVGPWQFYGIEINPYAFDLAQTTLWIGYLQWVRANGFGIEEDPILRPMDNFRNMDAVLDLTDPGDPKEPEWPSVDFIVGNPPFLGGKRMRSELGDDYVDKLFAIWKGRVPAEADLVAYWFEKTREQLEKGKCRRVGLLATQGIRGGANREVLKRIKDTGDIFFAESDREWILNGANVHVSMIGFDRGEESQRILDGSVVTTINSNLTSSADITQAGVLAENLEIAFMGDTKGGAFDISEDAALRMLKEPNPHGRPNSDVIVPWINGLDITRRLRDMYIIDFGIGTHQDDAALYESPFTYIKRYVLPAREKSRSTIQSWWLHERPRVDMRLALNNLPRFVCTPRVSKHRLFIWLQSPTLADSATFVFARSDDYFFGVLHSRLHEVWARAQGTQVRERESGFRYTPSTCFETFPFPSPADEQREAIAEAARRLDELRGNWLNPPEWVREEVLEFPGSTEGPWARYVLEASERGVGTVRYPRLVPKDAEAASNLSRRTLTNLYNQRPAWLDMAHGKLDEAVFAAYGWEPGISDEEILEGLLKLNLDRSPE